MELLVKVTIGLILLMTEVVRPVELALQTGMSIVLTVVYVKLIIFYLQ